MINTQINASKKYKVCDDSFGYLMYLLHKNKFFSELHLPSLNKINITKKKVTLIKAIPKIFKDRIEEIVSISKTSKKTAFIVDAVWNKGNTNYIKSHSQLGIINSAEKLSQSEKTKIITLFFDYHNELNTAKLKINTDYHSFFNFNKLNEDITKITQKINKSKKTTFDDNVLDYLKLVSEQKINPDFKLLRKVNVHGDFILRNIVKINKKYSLIDLDMAHKGYLEIQFIRLLKELFDFGTKDFFINLKKNQDKLSINKTNLPKIIDFYLFHKMLDLSAIKSAYFTNKIKYTQLQNHINSQIKFITDLTLNREKFLRLFKDNLE